MPREPKKVLLIILDGVGDRPLVNFMTPLQTAKHPNMDMLAQNGSCGIVDVIAPGVPPGSDTSHLALLGYDPYQVYTGRGPFEAIGLGMEVLPGDIAFRCNFATVDNDMMVKDRRAGRIRSGTEELAESLSGMVIDGISFYLKPGVEHRCALIMRGDGLSAEVSDVDPHVEGEAILRSKPLRKAAERTAEALNSFTRKSKEILSTSGVNVERREHGFPEANVVLARGAGIVPKLQSLAERTGMKGVCIAGIPIIKGIAKLAGIDTPSIFGVTGSKDTDLDAKFGAFLELKDKYDFFMINIKATDSYSHDGDFDGKVEFIERIDAAIAAIHGSIMDTVIAITGDHSTPVSVRDHTGDPLPICISGVDVRKDTVRTFDEISCAHGALGRIRGKDVLPIMMDLANRTEKFGA